MQLFSCRWLRHGRDSCINRELRFAPCSASKYEELFLMGQKPCVVAFDAGTGSGRCVIFDFDGRQLAAAQREWLPTSDPRYPGSQDFDTREAWQLLCNAVRQAMEQGHVSKESIAAVTATSMREGMVLYDRHCQVIWACPNVDARASAEVVEMLNHNLAQPIYELGGDWLNIISPPRFWWLRRHMPDIYNQIAHMTMLSDWVLFKLSGHLVTDPSVGSSSGVFDLRQRSWSSQVIELAGLPSQIYPDVHESGTLIGHVTPTAAEETGLAAGTPVVTGGGDTQLGLVGVGGVQPGQYTVCGGTFWQTALVTDRPLIDPRYRLRTLCHAIPGQWMTEGIGFYHGFTMRWFRDGFCQEEKQASVTQGSDAYALMERLAAQAPPGANGVHAIFSNVMDAKRWRHATPSLLGFDVLAPSRSGKKECIRAIEESAAYVSRGHIEILSELAGHAPTEVVFTGGSAKGFLWPQILADVMGVPVLIPQVKESTSLGAAICALRALGIYRSWDDAVKHVVRWERRIEPNQADRTVYDQLYEMWRRVYDYMLPIADEGVLPSLWRAPGA